jgi:sec-independent protein translocase protein TatB
MFDVGFAEILLLSLVGLLVLGPERLPRVARTLGGMARKARSSWLNLKRSIEAEMRAEELKEPLKHFQDEIKSTVDDVKTGVDSVRNFNPADLVKPAAPAEPEPAEKPGGKDDSS